MIAALNVFNALFMVVSALMGMVMLGVLDISIPGFFLVLSVMNLLVAGFIFQQLPEFLLRFIVWILSHTVYRGRHQGLRNIPDQGPVLLVCNHVTYMDALIIAAAVRRPVRFVMDHQIFGIPVLGGIFSMARAIPIGSQTSVPDIYRGAFEQIDETLDAGRVVCIFPEGRLTTDGDMDRFRSGVDTIVRKRRVPVVPMALRGLWGSFFSHCGGPPMRHLPRRFWSRIELLADARIPPDEAGAAMLEQRVRKLRGDAR